MVKTVFGNEEGTILNNPTLKPGRHSFNFSYRLPPVLPHSFDAGSAATTIGAVARIRYTARAKIDVHFGADVDSDAVEFLVEGLFDVNQAEGKDRKRERIGGGGGADSGMDGREMEKRKGRTNGRRKWTDIGNVDSEFMKLLDEGLFAVNQAEGKSEKRVGDGQ